MGKSKITLCSEVSEIFEDTISNLKRLSSLGITGEGRDAFHPDTFGKLVYDCAGATVVLEAAIRDKNIKIKRLEREIVELEKRIEKLESYSIIKDKE